MFERNMREEIRRLHWAQAKCGDEQLTSIESNLSVELENYIGHGLPNYVSMTTNI